MLNHVQKILTGYNTRNFNEENPIKSNNVDLYFWKINSFFMISHTFSMAYEENIKLKKNAVEFDQNMRNSLKDFDEYNHIVIKVMSWEIVDQK